MLVVLDVSQPTAAFLERRIMKKLNKVAVLFASAALAAPLIAMAQTPTAEQFKYASGADQWRNASGDPWRNGTNELCWRDSNWTPATAFPTCDGALQPPPPPPPAPRVAPPPPPPPAPAPAPAPVPAPKPAPVS